MHTHTHSLTPRVAPAFASMSMSMCGICGREANARSPRLSFGVREERAAWRVRKMWKTTVFRERRQTAARRCPLKCDLWARGAHVQSAAPPAALTPVSACAPVAVGSIAPPIARPKSGPKSPQRTTRDEQCARCTKESCSCRSSADGHLQEIYTARDVFARRTAGRRNGTLTCALLLLVHYAFALSESATRGDASAQPSAQRVNARAATRRAAAERKRNVCPSVSCACPVSALQAAGGGSQ